MICTAQCTYSVGSGSVLSRDYWMFYRGPGFLAIVYLQKGLYCIVHMPIFWACLVWSRDRTHRSKSIEWFADSPSYDLFGSSPSPTDPLRAPLPSVSSTGDTQGDWERETTRWREGGGGDGREAKSYDDKKAWSSINHLILFASVSLSLLYPRPRHTQNIDICTMQ